MFVATVPALYRGFYCCCQEETHPGTGTDLLYNCCVREGLQASMETRQSFGDLPWLARPVWAGRERERELELETENYNTLG